MIIYYTFLIIIIIIIIVFITIIVTTIYEGQQAATQDSTYTIEHKEPTGIQAKYNQIWLAMIGRAGMAVYLYKIQISHIALSQLIRTETTNERILLTQDQLNSDNYFQIPYLTVSRPDSKPRPL